MSLTRHERLLAALAAGSLLGGVVVAAAVQGPAPESVRLSDAALTAPPATTSRSRHASPPSPPPTSAPAAGASQPAPTPSPAHAALPYPLPAPAVQPEPCPPPPGHGGGEPVHLPPPAVADAAVPAPIPVAPHRADLAAISGKGIWLTTWPETDLDVASVVATARASGLHQLWVRTGGYKQGYYGDPLLAELLPAAHRAGLAVVAWDFPSLSDPAVDAERARRALAFSVDGQRIDAFSPDIEEATEGVYLSPARVARYLSLVRRDAGDRPVVATVYRPTDLQLKKYPYAAQAPYVDAFAPMVYWSCHEPGALVARSIARLARLRPVHAIGQSYDMGPDGGRQGMPSGAEIWRFLDSARRAGAVGASLYRYRDTKAPQWNALSAYPWS